MKYLSIDLETTGLDSERCSILEIACVLETGELLIDELPTYHRRVYSSSLYVEEKAYEMNRELIETMWTGNVNGGKVVEADKLCLDLKNWLVGLGEKERITVAGKNPTFDLRFLRKADHSGYLNFRKRVLDPTILWIVPGDTVPPDLKTCCERAGLDASGLHTALFDAQSIVRLLRMKGI